MLIVLAVARCCCTATTTTTLRRPDAVTRFGRYGGGGGDVRCDNSIRIPAGPYLRRVRIRVGLRKDIWGGGGNYIYI